MLKTSLKQQNELKVHSKFSSMNGNTINIKTLLSDLLQNQSFQLQVQNRFCVMTYHDRTSEQIQKSSEEILEMIRHYEKIIDKKIFKYYSQLRQKPMEKELNPEELLQIYKIQLQLRKQIISFQAYQVKKIEEQQRGYDSIQNIQFSIPIEINQTKKKIEEIQAFIDMATKKQKKRSDNLAKVQKNNLVQFQKMALLRSSMELQMIYEMTTSQRQMKINDSIYQFQSKLEDISAKLANLVKTAQSRHIFISSNKGLFVLKQKKAALNKLREDINKKIGLSKNNVKNVQTSIRRDIENMRKEIYQKQQKYLTVQKQLQQVSKKNTSFVLNDSVNKSLRRSISYNYAETLLKMKKTQKISNIQQEMKLNLSMNIQKNSQSLLKPNFKVKKMINQNHSSLSKAKKSYKNIENPIQYDELLLPTTLEKTRNKNTPRLFDRSKHMEQKKRQSLFNDKNKFASYQQQQIIIQQ